MGWFDVNYLGLGMIEDNLRDMKFGTSSWIGLGFEHESKLWRTGCDIVLLEKPYLGGTANYRHSCGKMGGFSGTAKHCTPVIAQIMVDILYDRLRKQASMRRASPLLGPHTSRLSPPRRILKDASLLRLILPSGFFRGS